MGQHNIERDFGSYERMRSEFSFTDLYTELDWDAPERLNIAHEACDRHADGDTVAMHHIDAAGDHREITFTELSARSNQVANCLTELGVTPGDRVITYLPRVPDHYTTLLGVLKAGGVYSAINERFGESGIAYRLEDSGARVVVTTAKNRSKIQSALDDSAVEHILVIGDGGEETEAEEATIHDFEQVVGSHSETFDLVETSGTENSLLYYTSGTTGLPKGVVHTHDWLLMAGTLSRYIEDLTPGDLYWSTADMGWLTGPLHSLGPWCWGNQVLIYEGEFDTRTWAEILDTYDVDVLHTVPTVYRSFKQEPALFAEFDIDLAHASSVGEPLTPSTVEWVRDQMGVTVHDTYGQTECGGVVISNVPTVEVRAGSMGKRMPGVELAVVDAETGTPKPTGEIGEIAWRPDAPYFKEYWNREGLKEASTVDGWFLSGDLAHEDEDGYFWFEGRADDVILSSGYRIGPFEVEKAISDHPAVAETAVVPKPDETRGNIVKAFVTLADPTDSPEELKSEIQQQVRSELSKHKYPREIEFVDAFPKTVTGKIRRTELTEDTE